MNGATHLLFWIAAFAPVAQAAEPDDDNAKITETLTRSFTAFQKGDLDGHLAEWSAKSPHRAKRKQLLQEMFVHTKERAPWAERMEFKSLKVDGDRAVANIRLHNSFSSQAYPSGRRMYWQVVRLIRESGSWRIHSWRTYYQDFAEVYAELPTAEERKKAWRSDPFMQDGSLIFYLMERSHDCERTDAARAMAIVEIAAELAENLGLKSHILWCRAMATRLRTDLSAKEKAAIYKAQVDDLETQRDFPRLTVYVRLLLARAWAESGQHQPAQIEFEKAIRHIENQELYLCSRADWFPGYPRQINDMVAQRARLIDDAERKSTSDPKAALATYLQVLETERALFGPAAGEIGETLGEIAELHLRLGDSTSAEKFARDALAMTTKMHGEKHWRKSSADSRLSRILLQSKWTARQRKQAAQADRDFQQAKKLPTFTADDKLNGELLNSLQQILKAQAKTHGVESIEYTATLLQLAARYGIANRCEESLKCLRQAAELRLKLWSPGDPKIDRMFDQWVHFLRLFIDNDLQDHRYDRVVKFSTERQDLLIRRYGTKDHYEVYNAVWEAEHLARRVALPEDKLKRVHTALDALARCRKAEPGSDDFAAGAKPAKDAYETLREVLGDDDVQTVIALDRYATFAANPADGTRDSAVEAFHDRIQKWYEQKGADRVGHPDLAHVHVYRALRLGSDGLYADALRECEIVRKYYRVGPGRFPVEYENVDIQSVSSLISLGQQSRALLMLNGVLCEHRKEIFGPAAIGYEPETMPFGFPLEQQSKGDLERLAEDYKCLAAFDEGPESHNVVTAMENTVRLYRLAVGADHMQTVSCQMKLAIQMSQRGQHDEALRMMVEIQARAMRLWGPDSKVVLQCANHLGLIHSEMGQFEDAEKAFQQAAEGTRKLYGPDNRNVQIHEENWASNSLHLGKTDEGMRRLNDAMLKNMQALARTLPTLSESEMLTYLNTNRRSLNTMISAARNGTPEQVRLAFTWYLRFQGLTFETLCRLRDVGASVTDPATRELMARARQARQRVQAMILESGRTDASAREVQIEAAEERARKLETELNRELAGLIGATFDPNKVQLAALVQALPRKTAYIDIFPLSPAQFGKPGGSLTKGGNLGAVRYFAFVIPAGDPNQVTLIDLGLVLDATEKIDLVQNDIRDYGSKAGGEKGKEQHFRTLARELAERVFDPLVEHLGKPESLLIAAQGKLHAVPFAALVDGEGKYLIEKYRISHVHSGRELLRPKPAAPGNGAYIFADPDYDLGGEALGAAVRNATPADDLALRGLDRNATRGLSWKALPGTRTEAQSIQAILANSEYARPSVYLGSEALHERLVGIRRPKLLHLATHGFYIDQSRPDEPAGTRKGTPSAETLLATHANPLFRCGIVLAGCNTFTKRAGNANAKSGYVTAEEFSMLDLQGTDLVVLSACLSGRGEARAYEGIYGPPRALLYAGAQSVVASLFAVPDAETQQLMTAFYKNLAAKKGKLDSLREAQQEMIAQRRAKSGAAHPLFWAGFTLTGAP